MDGTLLNTNDRINQESIEIINGLVDKGMLFTYATARSLVSASVVVEALSTKIPVIAYNGVLIIHPLTNEVFLSFSFSTEEAAYVKACLQKYNISPLVYSYVNHVEKVSWDVKGENEGIKRYLELRKGDKRLRPLDKEDALYDGNVFAITEIAAKMIRTVLFIQTSIFALMFACFKFMLALQTCRLKSKISYLSILQLHIFQKLGIYFI